MGKICRLFFLLAFFFCVNKSQAQVDLRVQWTNKSEIPATDVIYYHERPELDWKDFMGRNYESGSTAALTVSGFGYKADIAFTDTKGSLDVKVFCYFEKKKSWVKPEKKSDYILNHEQRHFDISFIAANVFINLLKTSNFTSENFNDLLEDIYKEACAVMSKLQKDYDSQSRNGNDKSEQEKWNDKIDRDLKSFTN